MHCHQFERSYSRRKFLSKTSLGLGAAALASIVDPVSLIAGTVPEDDVKGALDGLHFAPRVKRVIYLFQSGGPSQLELYDYKKNAIRSSR